MLNSPERIGAGRVTRRDRPQRVARLDDNGRARARPAWPPPRSTRRPARPPGRPAEQQREQHEPPAPGQPDPAPATAPGTAQGTTPRSSPSATARASPSPSPSQPPRRTEVRSNSRTKVYQTGTTEVETRARHVVQMFEVVRSPGYGHGHEYRPDRATSGDVSRTSLSAGKRQETVVSTEDRSTGQPASTDQQPDQPTSLAGPAAGCGPVRRPVGGRSRRARPLRAVTSVPSGLPEVLNEELTGRQRLILDFIREWVERHGYPPSVREIGEAVGLVSPSSVAYQLKELEKKGFLRRDPNRPRAVDVRPPSELSPDEEAAARAARPTPALRAGARPDRGRRADPRRAGRSRTSSRCPANWSARATCSCSRSRATRWSRRRSATATGSWSASSTTADDGDIVAAMLEGEATVKTLPAARRPRLADAAERGVRADRRRRRPRSWAAWWRCCAGSDRRRPPRAPDGAGYSSWDSRRRSSKPACSSE